MSVTITAEEANIPFPHDIDSALSDVLVDWGASLGTSHPTTTGTFSGTAANSWPTLFGTALSGTSYSYGDGVDYQFVVEGDLYYYFNETYTPSGLSPTPEQHTVFGYATSLSLYTDADADGVADDLWLTIDFSGVDLLDGALSEGHAGELHQVIAGLQEGDPTALLAALDARGIDGSDSIANLIGTSLAAESELLLAA
ncbi:MAG: heme acquisition protein HasA [Sphingobium sp.]